MENLREIEVGRKRLVGDDTMREVSTCHRNILIAKKGRGLENRSSAPRKTFKLSLNVYAKKKGK